MAVPSLGKCVVLLVLVLILYTGYAFKIRDVIQSIQQSRSNVCGSPGFGKCPGDGSRTDPSLISVSSTRKRYETVGADVTRARFASKSRQPPVEAQASEESVQDDGGRHMGKTSSIYTSSSSSSGKFDKWTRNVPESKQTKFKRSVIKDDEAEEEESEEAVIREEDNDDNEETEEDDEDDVEEIDADSEDDGVEVSNGDGSAEDSEDIVVDADDDDDDEDSNDDASQSEEETKTNDYNDDDDDDDIKVDKEDDNSKLISKKIGGGDKTHTVTGTKSVVQKRIVDNRDPSINEDVSKKESLDRVSKKITEGKKIALKVYEEKEENNREDEEVESERLKKQLTDKVLKESAKQKENESDKNIDKDAKKREITGSRIDDDDNDDDKDADTDKDDKSKAAPATPIPSPVRKLEKVRLADKEKAKSIESAQPAKAVSSVPDKLAKPKEITKKIEEPKKKKKDEEQVAGATNLETQTPKTTNPVKPETKVKLDSSKPAKVLVKSDASKPVTSKDISKSDTPKSEKLVVSKTKYDMLEVQEAMKQSKKSKAEQPSDAKTKDKRTEVSGGTDKKDQSKPKTKKPPDASMSLTELNDAILRTPTFVPNFTAVEDPICQQHGKIFLRQLRGYKLWALQMLDASAKIPSGLLRGNINQLGDFDQCLGITARVKVDEKTVKVQGKYCLAQLDLHASLPDMKVAVNLMQSRAFLRTNMRDSGHFVPRFTIANWALCIPAACSADDARIAIENALSHLNISSGLRFNVDVDPEMCYVRQKTQTYSKETIGVLYFFAMIICIVLVATVRDYFVISQEKGNYSERIIMSFSLRRTVRILMKEGNSDGNDISCIHGIRTIATGALYLAHRLMPVAHIPFANRILLTEISTTPVSCLLRSSVVYTDCFLLLSGVLTAFNMARETTKRGEIRWFCRSVARYVRLTPTFLVTVFWYAYVMEHTGSGPKWNPVVVANAQLCKENSWTNLLYIQNFFPFDEMCAPHTHQLALDMQLSLLAPIFVFFLTFKPIIGILLIFFLVQVSATLRYFATINNHLSLFIYHGVTMKQLYKTANLSYALPLHRATPYIFGVGLGVLLHYTGKNVRIYRIFVILGWLIASALGLWSVFSPWRMSMRNYVYDVEEAAHYDVIAPVTSSLAVCWIIFACFTEHGGVINKFLSSYWMLFFSRISYAVYICQFAIFFYNVGTTRYSNGFQISSLLDPYEAVAVILISIILTLFVDIPMQEAKNVIMDSTDSFTVPVAKEDTITESKEKTAVQESGIYVTAEIRKEEEKTKTTSWDSQEDVTDGLIRHEDSADEESVDKWRPKIKSNGTRGTSMRHEPYEDREEEEEEEEEEEDYDEESEQAEWEWRRRSRSRMSIEDDGLMERESVRSRSNQRSSYNEPDNFRRERRSLSRQPDRSYQQDESPRGSLKRDRPLLRASEPRMTRQETEDLSSSRHFSRVEPRASSTGRDYEKFTTSLRENVRHDRSPRSSLTSRREPARLVSSGSEDDPNLVQQQPQRASKTVRKQPAEPKVSDEEDWEQELRIRRRKFMERLASEDRDNKLPDEGNDGWDSFKRRSSAEGKLALLKGPTGSNVMDSWTVSRGPRVSLLGSSQETEDDSPSVQTQKDHREIQRSEPFKEDDRSEEESSAELSRRQLYTSGSQVTSLEDEEDVANYDFVLKKDSKRITVMDLSKLSQQEESESEVDRSGRKVVKEDEEEEAREDGQPKMATLKLFKRESIVKSQASEEDPEYLLPERPKLVEQEQDHPFKKAWQLQKSRSEEDGPSAYALKEVKTAADSLKNRSKDNNDNKDKDNDYNEVNKEATSTKSSSGGQSLEESTHHDDNSDVMTIWQSRSFDVEDSISSSKSGTETDSGKIDWPSEEEQFNRYKLCRRRQSEEANHAGEFDET